MNQKHRKVLPRHHPWMVAFAGLFLLGAVGTSAQPGGGMDGTWKLTPARSALAPDAAFQIPLTKEGLAHYEDNKKLAAKGDFSFDQMLTSCSSPGLPRLMLAPGRFRIFQRDRVVSMIFEWNRQFRQIELRDVPQTRPLVDSMNGVSFGHWEGDTLVVKSFGFFPDKLLDNYLRGSDALELVERIRLTGKDTLEDRVTITDPENFTRPWEAVLTYQRQKDEAFPEDNCLDRKKAGQARLSH